MGVGVAVAADQQHHRWAGAEVVGRYVKHCVDRDAFGGASRGGRGRQVRRVVECAKCAGGLVRVRVRVRARVRARARVGVGG